MNKELLRESLIVFNVMAFIFGTLVAYSYQLSVTHPLLWIFVPDCPLAGLLFAVSLLLLIFNKRVNAFFLLTIVSGIKYGVWTLTTIFSYWDYYVSPLNFESQLINLGMHVVLILQQSLLIGSVKVNKRQLVLVMLLLLAQDLSDYLLGTKPFMPDYAVPSMFKFTIALTIASSITAYYLIDNKKLRGFPIIVDS